MTTFEVRAIGAVESVLIDRKNAPRQPDEGAPEAWLVFDDDVQEGMRDIRVGDEIVVLTWLHLARRETLSVHPRGSRPLTGVFSTRSPDRPNPIGLHRTHVSAIEAGRIRVRGLEAVNGTPILDVKPVLSDDVDLR